MPQAATQRKSSDRTPKQAQPAQKPAPQSAPAETEDEVYGLVSVLYHSLQGVQACDQYVADAERAGDEELVSFFEECRTEQASRAARAKQLLVGRAAEEVEDEDEDDDDDDEDEEEDDDDEE